MAIIEKIENIKQQVLKMSDCVIENITDAISFYLGKNKIKSINDDLIDQYERLIEEMCINVLLRERLYAKDLKEVTGVLKLVSDLERIGDHAEDIYNFSLKLENYKEPKILEIEGLSIYVMNMLKQAMKAYIDKDYDLAKKVISEDDYVDNKYLEILEKISNKKNIDQEYLPFAIYTTLVVKYLERIADHSVNIAEWAVYISSGFYKDKNII